MAAVCNLTKICQLDHVCTQIIFFWIRDFLLFAACVIIMVSAILEFVFAPMMTLKYLIPSAFRNASHDLVLAFYLSCIFTQVFNILASSSLFASTILTGYKEKLFAYDTFSLVSVSISLSLAMHRVMTDIDIYESNVEKDIYYQVTSIGDLQCFSNGKCEPTDVFKWHQENQCCGWESAEELLNRHDNSGLLQVPAFCCFLNSTLNSYGSMCKIDSTNRFKEICSDMRTSFKLHLRSFPFISHPCSVPYTVFKIFTTMAYTILKKFSIIPQSEGLYSFYLPA